MREQLPFRILGAQGPGTAFEEMIRLCMMVSSWHDWRSQAMTSLLMEYEPDFLRSYWTDRTFSTAGGAV